LNISRASRAGAIGLACIGLALPGLIWAGRALHPPGDIGLSTTFSRTGFTAVSLLACLLHALAVRLLGRAMLPRGAVWGVLAVAVAMRAIALPAPPFLSTDVFRYVWDGRVQVAGVNPYRFVPADPALSTLRDGAIYPNINRASYARTIYPPFAETMFALVAALRGSVPAMKAAMVGVEALAILALLRLLALARLPAARVLIYAWHPLPVWEFAGNGHVDALVVGGVALALLARASGRPMAGGVALAAAVLAKFLPVVLLPALLRPREGRFLLGFVGLIVLLYLRYIGVGWRVFGFLPHYAAEEGLRDSSGPYPLFLLSRLHPLSPAAMALYLAALALGLALIGWRVLHGPAGLLARARGMLLLSTVLMAALSPQYPWYFAWLLVPACLLPAPSVLYLAGASFLLYLGPLHDKLILWSLIYVPFLILALRDIHRPPSCVALEQQGHEPR
jgi:hypothetical protein